MQHSPILIIEMEAMQPHFAQFPSMPPIPVGSVTFGWARSRLGIGLQKRCLARVPQVPQYQRLGPISLMKLVTGKYGK
jgi:hypothetical protein